jgi:hypothetical protein
VRRDRANILSIWTKLAKPTRRRASKLSAISVATTTALYLMLGLLGCAYGACAQGYVTDNILNSMPNDSAAANVAR